MGLSTYTEMKASIAGWLHRDDLTTVIPDFITLAEAEMQRLLTCGEQETTSVLSLTQGVQTLTLPTGFNKLRRIRYLFGGVYTDMFPFALAPTYGDGVTQMTPRAVSLQGNTLVFANPADQTYPIVVDYYAKFTPLSASVATNWILDSHPDAYLYGSLLQSAPFLGTDNRIDLWDSAFTEVITEINQEDFQKRSSQLTQVSDCAWAGRAQLGYRGVR